MTVREALWDYPLSAILQMMHAKGIANGGDYDWVEAGEADEDLVNMVDEMFSVPVEDLLSNY